MRPPSVLSLLLVGLLCACQPVDDLSSVQISATADTESAATAGAVGALPLTLPELWSRGQTLADEWQGQARPVTAEVTLDEQGWADAEVRYLAADADRLLSVAFLDGTIATEQVSLSMFGAEPLTDSGLQQVPDGARDWLEPEDLLTAAQAVLEECGLGGANRVLYTTGAPASWTKQGWASAPRWKAMIIGADGHSAIVDPSTGESSTDDPCPDVS